MKVHQGLTAETQLKVNVVQRVNPVHQFLVTQVDQAYPASMVHLVERVN